MSERLKYTGRTLRGKGSQPLVFDDFKGGANGKELGRQTHQSLDVTGAPISWILGGNPFLEGIWLFSNGVLCFHQGYKFFMIALAGQEDVARVVREIKGLLPAGEAA